jgi:outer membrane protein
MTKYIRLSFAVLVLILGFGAKSTVYAQAVEELKVGYVNPQAILANMPEMKAVQQRLQNFTIRKQQELEQKNIAFQSAVTTYQQKIGVISSEAQAAEEQRLGQMQAELVQAQEQAEAELDQKRQELIGPLNEQIFQAISTVADRLQLSYVLNSTTNTGDYVILYASEEYSAKYDITEAVMEELGMF